MGEIIAAFDIGSSKTAAVIGETDKRNGVLKILGVGQSPCNGVIKGLISDVEDTAKSIISALNQAENMADINHIDYTAAAIPGGIASLVRDENVMAISNPDKGISQTDVDKLVRSFRLKQVPLGEEIIAILPIHYLLDSYDEVKEPVGMVASELGLEAKVALVPEIAAHNLRKAVEMAGITLPMITLEPIASASIVLSNDEKERGVALVDVGAGITDISVFNDGNLIYTSIIPVGGGHITNDIALGFRLTFNEAEEIKKKYAQAMEAWIEEDMEIPATNMDDESIIISQKEVAYIVEARIQEIFSLVRKNLEDSGYIDKIPAGIVLSGGGLSLLKGAKELGRSVLEMPIRTGAPDIIGLSNPTFSVSVGLAVYASGGAKQIDFIMNQRENEHKKGRNAASAWDGIKKAFNNFFNGKKF